MALPQQAFQQQPGGCLVGSEGGAVFRCSLDSTAPARQAFAQVVSTLLISAHPTSCGVAAELSQPFVEE